ncbi:MAG: hypothetical protein LBJ46_08360 [Planctomycetota bacterium]|jgi:heptose II phosphotransferase|nr:hypothetical protein [Planctomycetota bacterium]
MAGKPIIRHETRDGFNVYVKDDGRDYWDILRRFMDGRLEAERYPYTIADHRVYFIADGGRKYVLKHDWEKDPRLEIRLWRWLCGPFYSRLMRRVDRAAAEGCDVIQEIYLVAEKIGERAYPETYALIEFCPGGCLAAQDSIAKYHPAIIETVQKLHRHRLAFLDVHARNIIVQDDGGLKIIDVSNRGTFLLGRAKDVVRLRQRYGIDLPSRGAVEKLMVRIVRAQEWLRDFFRALRDHPEAPGNRREFDERKK